MTEQKKDFYTVVSSLESALAKFEVWFASCTFAAMLIDVIAGIIMRKVLKIAFPWGEELARYLMIAGIMAGLGVCVRQRTHTRVDLFINFLPKISHGYFLLFDDLITLLCYIALDYYSIQFLNANKGLGQFSSTLHFPMYWVYYLLIIGFTLSAIEQIYLIYKDHIKNHMYKGGGK